MSASTEWQTELVEVADGVFAYVQATGGLCISNASFIVGEDDVLIVDSLFTRSMNREFQAQMRRVTAKPASLLINPPRDRARSAAGRRPRDSSLPRAGRSSSLANPRGCE